MIKNYFTITVRIIRRYKIHSLINIVGLSVGMACAILVFLYNQHEFSYNISLHPLIFFVSGLTAFLIALLTVSYQSLKAARSNPVDTLRYE